MLRLLLALVLLGSTTADYECSNAVLGDKCGTRYCPPEESYCDTTTNTCKCASGYGQDEMLCSNSDDYFASVLNDPRVWSYQKREKGELPVPCFYLFSHAKTKVKMDTSPNGECDIKVNLYNERQDGKMYVAGYEVKIQTSGMSTGDKTLIFKVDATAQNGQYCFDMSVSVNGGHFMRDFRNHEDYNTFTFTLERWTNRVKLQVGYCGLYTNFRPADRSYKVFDQPWLPAFAMKLDKDNEPTFHSKDEVVSLPPGHFLSGAAGPYRTPTDELIFRAFTSSANAITRFPNYSPKCPAVKQALLNCPNEEKKTLALEKCRWIIGKPLFVDCWSNNVIDEFNEWADPYGKVNRILELYRNCVTTVCSADTVQCMALRNHLQNMPLKCKTVTPDQMLEMPCDYS